MADDAQSPQERDPDLVGWARELGVTYEELVSTLDYAGPTFRDRALELTGAAMPESPTDTKSPSLPGAGNILGAPSPGIAAARHRPR